MALASVSTNPVAIPVRRTPLNQNQIRGFWAAWGGWALDGLGAFIYSLVLVPALQELLPKSGIAATPGNVGYYGGLLFALFLAGWGCSMIWGPIADRFGRVRALILTIVTYTVFTFASGMAQTIWQLAILRLLSGLAIGGSWSMGGTFVAESWPEDRRKAGGGYMHSGYYFGMLVAAVLYYFVGIRYGWRVMFLLAAVPAIPLAFLQLSVHESETYKKGVARKRPSMKDSFATIFGPIYARRTVLNSIYLFVSIVGLWAGSVYVPASVTQAAMRSGFAAPDAARMASYASMLLAIGTILGCLVVPAIAERLGRRTTLGIFFALMFLSISIGFGYLFFQPNAIYQFMACLFVLGVGGANFAVYTMWIPEQYSTACRGSAFAFTSSVGRFGGAVVTFLVGSGVAYFGNIGTPVALTSLAFVLGLLLLPLGEETVGKPLPT